MSLKENLKERFNYLCAQLALRKAQGELDFKNIAGTFADAARNPWNRRHPVAVDPYKQFNLMLKKWTGAEISKTTFTGREEYFKKLFELVQKRDNFMHDAHSYLFQYLYKHDRDIIFNTDFASSLSMFTEMEAAGFLYVHDWTTQYGDELIRGEDYYSQLAEIYLDLYDRYDIEQLLTSDISGEEYKHLLESREFSEDRLSALIGGVPRNNLFPGQ